MSKQFIGVQLRDVICEMRMTDAVSGEVVSITRLPLRAGGRVFGTLKDRAAWIAAMNAEHGPGTAVEREKVRALPPIAL